MRRALIVYDSNVKNPQEMKLQIKAFIKTLKSFRIKSRVAEAGAALKYVEQEKNNLDVVLFLAKDYLLEKRIELNGVPCVNAPIMNHILEDKYVLFELLKKYHIETLNYVKLPHLLFGYPRNYLKVLDTINAHEISFPFYLIPRYRLEEVKNGYYEIQNFSKLEQLLALNKDSDYLVLSKSPSPFIKYTFYLAYDKPIATFIEGVDKSRKPYIHGVKFKKVPENVARLALKVASVLKLDISRVQIGLMYDKTYRLLKVESGLDTLRYENAARIDLTYRVSKAIKKNLATLFKRIGG